MDNQFSSISNQNEININIMAAAQLSIERPLTE